MKSKRSKVYPPDVRRARGILRERGWTYSSAAQELGVSKTHLALVLTNVRQSARLLSAIDMLPDFN